MVFPIFASQLKLMSNDIKKHNQNTLKSFVSLHDSWYHCRVVMLFAARDDLRENGCLRRQENVLCPGLDPAIKNVRQFSQAKNARQISHIYNSFIYHFSAICTEKSPCRLSKNRNKKNIQLY